MLIKSSSDTKQQHFTPVYYQHNTSKTTADPNCSKHFQILITDLTRQQKKKKKSSIFFSPKNLLLGAMQLVHLPEDGLSHALCPWERLTCIFGLKRGTLHLFLHFWNRKKSQGERSGEYSGYSKLSQDFS